MKLIRIIDDGDDVIGGDEALGSARVTPQLLAQLDGSAEQIVNRQLHDVSALKPIVIASDSDSDSDGFITTRLKRARKEPDACEVSPKDSNRIGGFGSFSSGLDSERSWSCQSCTLLSDLAEQLCTACCTPRSGLTEVELTVATRIPFQTDADWSRGQGSNDAG